ncbi:hypothetical protein P280DRAFT_484368 [Massarina eburnea CBS 473.64]|uniref:Uncharacterized protein n=1 Tax=Massarina eburnea CBS 473.64 TaxID=1395130 RepID=A0A6A6RKT9_9PLEO|nr:hypothetical protein P280DRAFT_484368 [Massarina eburnea CBS 473.64]
MRFALLAAATIGVLPVIAAQGVDPIESLATTSLFDSWGDGAKFEWKMKLYGEYRDAEVKFKDKDNGHDAECTLRLIPNTGCFGLGCKSDERQLDQQFAEALCRDAARGTTKIKCEKECRHDKCEVECEDEDIHGQVHECKWKCDKDGFDCALSKCNYDERGDNQDQTVPSPPRKVRDIMGEDAKLKCDRHHHHDYCQVKCKFDNWDNKKYKYEMRCDKDCYDCIVSEAKEDKRDVDEKQDWHIGCIDAGTCSYYEDQHPLSRRRLALEASNDDLAEQNPIPSGDMRNTVTRCKSDRITVQGRSSNASKWEDFYKCARPRSCVDLGGYAACHDRGQWYNLPRYHSLYVYRCENPRNPATCLRYETRPIKNFDSLGSQTKTQETLHKRDDYSFRCDPKAQNQVQYLEVGTHEWYTLQQCPNNGLCEDHVGAVMCFDGHDYTPIFFHTSPVNHKIASGDIDIRCAPQDKSRKWLQYKTNQLWINFYQCSGSCEKLDEFVACREQSDKYFVPYPPLEIPAKSATLQPRENSPVPDFHTYYTRCNTENSNEVEVLLDGVWQHLYTCTFKGSCVDVDGHGACRLKGNNFELPAANNSSLNAGEPENPLRIRTKCNAGNETEVQEWNGRKWEFNGVCLPPLTCHDFGGDADFAFCGNRNLDKTQVWLPWPSLSQQGRMTRCRSKRAVEKFNGHSWVPYQQCPSKFKCKELSDEPRNGGCVVPNVDHVFPMPEPETEHHHARRSLNADQDLQPRKQDGLIEDSEREITQGEILRDEGADLIKESDQLFEAIFGPNPGQTASMHPGPSPSPTSHVHRRAEEGLIDDSHNMHGQGQHLVDEGSKLIEQGRRLLRAIFGDRTDQFIANYTSSMDLEREKAQATGISQPVSNHTSSVEIKHDQVKATGTSHVSHRDEVDAAFANAEERNNDTDSDTSDSDYSDFYDTDGDDENVQHRFEVPPHSVMFPHTHLPISHGEKDKH